MKRGAWGYATLLWILEANPELKTLAVTWSMDITGMTNSGNLKRVRQDLATLTGRFIQAFQGK